MLAPGGPVNKVDGLIQCSAVPSRDLPTISPMHPTLVPEPFHRAGWVYEEKYDGWRMIDYKDGARVCLISRNNVDHTARFPELANAIATLRR